MSGDGVQPAGSPKAGEPAFIAIGMIRRPHGVVGEVLMEVFTDFPERILPKKVVYAGEKHIPLTIRRTRPHKDGLLLAFEGLTTPELVGRYRNQVIYVPRADLPALQQGEFYFHQLLGVKVVDETGRTLGTLTDILQTGANDVYVVNDSGGREILLPAIPEVVLDVDPQEKTMRIRLIPGLLDEEST